MQVLTEYDLIPIGQTDLGKINSFTGKLVDFKNPTQDMITITDIAKGLANVCRFGGQIHSHYSVAQHTILVWHLAPTQLKKAALLHDASEAYLGDVIKPLKNILGSKYTTIEKQFEKIIFSKFNVPIKQLEKIKPFDIQALELEHNYFRFNNHELIAIQDEIKTKLGWYSSPEIMLSTILNNTF